MTVAPVGRVPPASPPLTPVGRGLVAVGGVPAVTVGAVGALTGGEVGSATVGVLRVVGLPVSVGADVTRVGGEAGPGADPTSPSRLRYREVKLQTFCVPSTMSPEIKPPAAGESTPVQFWRRSCPPA